MSLLNDDDEFAIDRLQLELEAERNPALLRKYGKLLANATAVTKDEKRKLDFIETEQAELIRANAKAYGIEGRPTDKVVFGLVKGEPEYIKQFKKYIHAVRREENYKSAVDTCNQRGWMIRVLTTQWINEYWSGPVVYNHQPSRKRPQLQVKKDDNRSEY